MRFSGMPSLFFINTKPLPAIHWQSSLTIPVGLTVSYQILFDILYSLRNSIFLNKIKNINKYKEHVKLYKRYSVHRHSIISLRSPLFSPPYIHLSLISTSSFTCIHTLITSSLFSHMHFQVEYTFLSYTHIIKKFHISTHNLI